MSLYNLLFGKNPFSALLLEMLGTSEGDIPRFRDCYLGEGEIIIHTRTGGGNRDYYDHPDRHRKNCEYAECAHEGPFNSDLRALSGFMYDEDDDFDSTYADFHFAIPPAFRTQIELLRQMGGETKPPADKWQALLSELKTGAKTPETERALKIGERIFAQINEHLQKP